MKSLLIVAGIGPPENRRILADVWEVCPGWSVRRYDAIDQALAADMPDGDIVLVIQSRPWEFSHEAVSRLYQAFPLARIIVALGPWCGSALRREMVWPASATLPVAGLVDRLRREIEVIESGVPGLPRTASIEELVLQAPPSRLLPRGMKVAISSPDRALRAWLADLVAEAEGVSLAPDAPGAAALICDIDPGETLRAAAMKTLWHEFRGRPIVALTAAPTVRLVRELTERGASRVLAKPCDGHTLVQALAVPWPAVTSGRAADLIAFPGM